MHTPCPGETRTQRFRALTRDYEVLPQYGDDGFVEQYAKRHHEELLRAKSDILQEDHAFKQDPYFIAYLKAVAPRLLRWATWRARALQIAERLDAGEVLSLAPAKRKLTPEEFRAHLLRRQQVQADDKIALAQDRIEAVLKARKFLDQYDLDEEERQKYENELTADLLAGEEQPTTTHKQL